MLVALGLAATKNENGRIAWTDHRECLSIWPVHLPALHAARVIMAPGPAGRAASAGLGALFTVRPPGCCSWPASPGECTKDP